MNHPSSSLVQATTTRGVLVLSITMPRLDDYQRCRELGAAMVAAVGQSGTERVVADLAAVEYVSSVGLMPLLSLHRAVRTAGGRLVLCNVSDFVAEVFRATHLLVNPGAPQAPLERQPTLDEAIQQITSA